MTPPADIARYKNHRFPGEIISLGVWLYYRFTLSYRDGLCRKLPKIGKLRLASH